ncbi:MAG: HigA family addiction module antitoxin [bacterium]
MIDKKVYPYLNIGPGAFIKEELKAHGLYQDDLAAVLGMFLKSVNKLIKNKQAITVKTAQRLSKAFRQSPQFWLALDENYRLRLKQNISDKIPRKFWAEKNLSKVRKINK